MKSIYKNVSIGNQIRWPVIFFFRKNCSIVTTMKKKKKITINNTICTVGNWTQRNSDSDWDRKRNRDKTRHTII